MLCDLIECLRSLRVNANDIFDSYNSKLPLINGYKQYPFHQSKIYGQCKPILDKKKSKKQETDFVMLTENNDSKVPRRAESY